MRPRATTLTPPRRSPDLVLPEPGFDQSVQRGIGAIEDVECGSVDGEAKSAPREHDGRQLPRRRVALEPIWASRP